MKKTSEFSLLRTVDDGDGTSIISASISSKSSSLRLLSGLNSILLNQ